MTPLLKTWKEICSGLWTNGEEFGDAQDISNYESFAQVTKNIAREVFVDASYSEE